MKKAVHFGAGNIGRGFIGDLLNESGYEIFFLDVSDELTQKLNKDGCYELYLIDHNYALKTIQPVSALSTIKQKDACIQAIVDADIITTSVWANNLPKIAPLLAQGLKARLEANRPRVNVLACENAMFGTDILKKAMAESDVDITMEQLDAIAGFPNTAVDRVVLGGEKDGRPIVNIADYHELAVEETKLVDHDEKPIRGAHYTNNLQKFLERKLYVINCGHAYAGYLGYIHGLTSVYDVFMTPEYVAEIRKAMLESAKLIEKKYDFTEQEMKEYVDFGIKRYQTKGVDYPVSMVTRSPIRKLGASDRMVGPCTQCEEYGLPNDGLIKGIALILLLDREDDAEAVELQNSITKIGIENAIEHYSGIRTGTSLQKRILDYYNELKKIRDNR
ncbi:MAG: mannitol dehydrogenase [Eubacteriaceae bacterium]|jgi:mannitol-1-phosphate 5-dehydrogenase